MKNQEEKTNRRKELERFYAKCPDVLKPRAASKWMPIGRNKIFEAIHKGELRSFVYRGGYIISKEDMIDYLLEHCDDPSPWSSRLPNVRIKDTRNYEKES